jgi:hypothetical protein
MKLKERTFRNKLKTENNFRKNKKKMSWKKKKTETDVFTTTRQREAETRKIFPLFSFANLTKNIFI